MEQQLLLFTWNEKSLENINSNQPDYNYRSSYSVYHNHDK